MSGFPFGFLFPALPLAIEPPPCTVLPVLGHGFLIYDSSGSKELWDLFAQDCSREFEKLAPLPFADSTFVQRKVKQLVDTLSF